MPRDRLKEEFIKYVESIQADHSWSATPAQLAAPLVRIAEEYGAQREATLIGAHARERAARDAETAALRRRIAEQEAEIESATRLIARLQMPVVAS